MNFHLNNNNKDNYGSSKILWYFKVDLHLNVDIICLY